MSSGLRPVEPLDFVQNDEETRWLSDTEQQAWQGFLSLNRVVFAALEARLQSQSGMPLAYYAILVTLSEAPDQTLRMGELAHRLQAAPSSTTRAVARLESSGWVERRSDPTDRRAQFAALTNAGSRALAAAAPGHVTAVREHLLEPLTPEQLNQLIHISEAVLAHHRQPDKAAPATTPNAEEPPE